MELLLAGSLALLLAFLLAFLLALRPALRLALRLAMCREQFERTRSVLIFFIQFNKFWPYHWLPNWVADY